MKNKKPGTAVKTSALIIVSLAVALIFAEGGLRLAASAGLFPELFTMLGRAKPPIDSRDGPGMYYIHQYSAYAIKPGYKRADFELINSHGFRGEEFNVPKPDDMYRIVAIGGSTTFGVYVPYTKTFPVYLQQELRERLKQQNIEVVNAGLTGSTTAESLHRLFTQIFPLDPNMVIIYHGYNDLFPRIFNNYQDDYYHFRKADPNNPPGLTKFLIYRIALRALSAAAFHENYNLASIVWQTKNLPDSDAERMENFFSSNTNAFKNNLENMILVLRANGVQPVLATFAISKDIRHWNDYIPAFLWEEGIRQHNQIIRELAEKHSVPLVPFAERGDNLLIANAYQDKNACCYEDSIHMTPVGNEVKADIFADTIEPLVKAAMGSEDAGDIKLAAQ